MRSHKFNIALARMLCGVFLLTSLVLPGGSKAQAEDGPTFGDYLKGCIIVGGVGVGGTVLAASTSHSNIRDSQSLVVAAFTSCIVGGFLSGDLVRKKRLEAEADIGFQNLALKNRVFSVMHDLCVIQHTCGPDGILYCIKNHTCGPYGEALTDQAVMTSKGKEGKDGEAGDQAAQAAAASTVQQDESNLMTNGAGEVTDYTRLLPAKTAN